MHRSIIDSSTSVAKINVTPIIDVALVLVIILLITAPILVVTDMEINLPEAQTRSVEDEARVSITLGKNGEMAIDDQVISPGRLMSALGQRLSDGKDKDVLVVVRADEGVPYKSVHGILQQAREAGAKRIAIATRQRGGGRP